MGCFSSKEYEQDKPQTILQTSPLQEQPDVVKPAVQTATREAVAPRPESNVTDVDRMELKLKTSKDRLESFLTNVDERLKEEAVSAIEAKQQGHMNKYKVYVRRRAVLKEQVKRKEAMLITINTNIETLLSARDQADTLAALEAGNKAMTEIMKDVTVQRVEKALQDQSDHMAFAKEIDQMINEQGVEEDDLNDALADLEEYEKKLAPQTEVPAETVAAPAAPKVDGSLQTALNIPDVPTQEPSRPVAPEVEEQGEDRILEAA